MAAGRSSRGKLDCSKHDYSALDGTAYAYLLGIYLGDGCISSHPRGVWRLRITLDSIYPGIVAECVRALEAIAPGNAYVIALADWQRQIVSSHVKPFLRGLIHSDGTRIIATERKGQYVRRAPCYGFSNRSEDILGIFRDACELAGAHCTRASQKQIAVYKKDSVAILDEFIGPKR